MISSGSLSGDSWFPTHHSKCPNLADSDPPRADTRQEPWRGWRCYCLLHLMLILDMDRAPGALSALFPRLRTSGQVENCHLWTKRGAFFSFIEYLQVEKYLLYLVESLPSCYACRSSSLGGGYDYWVTLYHFL